ncbi:hypothetical protein B0H66DRAFT_545245 [Apodospora peruviana]|uniref:DUF7704 domain-containing protein n=1 Tax=Apodospora peruviana TaxID=516989 RepID=A0AAE0IUR3_9PEZI|nr:hypothetical protein B0H66DRAFT_545245 [Apodospora peruviana]
MTSQLPAFPRFVFSVFEPISILAGTIGAVFTPEWFFSEQIPALTNTSAVNPPINANSRLVTQQLGNTYGVAALVGIAVLYTTSEIKVVRNYLIALWIMDIGHVVITYLALGHERAMAVGQWNAMTWGNIGATVFLFIVRSLYFLGLFGSEHQKSRSSLGRKAL